MVSSGGEDLYWRCRLFLFLALSALVLVSRPTLAQTGTTSWAGQITCQLDDQDATYSRHEIQTWKLLGGPPDPQPGIPHYAAIWSASGQGALQRVHGTETVNIQWTTSVPSANAMIAIFLRASDQKLIIKTWHGQITVPNAVIGTKQVTQNGVTLPGGSFSHAAWEWAFPRIEVDVTGTVVTGSITSQADGGSAEVVHHYGGVPPNTTCQWQLASGGVAVPVATPPAGGNAGPTLAPGAVSALPQQPLTGVLLPPSGTPPVQGTVSALPQQPLTGVLLPPSGTPPVQGTVSALPQQPLTGVQLPPSGTPPVQGTVSALPQQPLTGVQLPPSETPPVQGTVSALPSTGIVLPGSGNPPVQGTVMARPVKAPVIAASGNYLITMTGLLCLNPTVDDQLNRDGKGDEIYGDAFIRQYNRTTGQLTNSSNAQTWVYGDTNGFQDAQGNPLRQQAGSLSYLGGITVGDFIPDQPTAQSIVNPWRRARTYFR